MKKKEFMDYCKSRGLECTYSGKENTVFVSGKDAHKICKHMVSPHFKIVINENS